MVYEGLDLEPDNNTMQQGC